jgi:hypothetical protein
VTDAVVELETVEPVESAESGQPAPVSDEQLVAMLVERARSEGLQLTGLGGLLQQLTKRVLESALEGEITDHLVDRGAELCPQQQDRAVVLAVAHAAAHALLDPLDLPRQPDGAVGQRDSLAPLHPVQGPRDLVEDQQTAGTGREVDAVVPVVDTMGGASLNKLRYHRSPGQPLTTLMVRRPENSKA